jgi:hypothetical protein
VTWRIEVQRGHDTPWWVQWKAGALTSDPPELVELVERIVASGQAVAATTTGPFEAPGLSVAHVAYRLTLMALDRYLGTPDADITTTGSEWRWPLPASLPDRIY